MNKYVHICRISLLFFAFSLRSQLQAQEYRLPLYTGPIPYALDNPVQETVERREITAIRFVQVPDIAVYLPTRKFSTGQAVVICPGGGYWALAYDHEGTDIARYLNSIGVAAAVLKYRLPTNGNCSVPHRVPLTDAQRAIRLVRYHAAEWNIDPAKIGIMGFSAGGHLASTLGTHFDYGDPAAADSIEKMSCRPDFMILMYPVISFTDSSMHKGSRNALLGSNPDHDLITFYSNELQVKEDTPPAFFVHADDDKGVPVENTLLMYQALRQKGISAEVHILSQGGHGFGLGLGNDHVASWTESLREWLEHLK
jgi:acetyl esterase/lipase